MIKLLFNTLSILKKKHGMALEMIKAAINHVFMLCVRKQVA